MFFTLIYYTILASNYDSSKKRKNGAKIWNNSQRIINYNRTFRVESKQKSNNVSRAWYFLSEIKIIHISILIPKDLLYILGSMIPGELWTSSCSFAQQSFHSKKKKKKELIYISFVATFGRGGWRVVRQRDKTERGKERKVRDTKRNGEEGEREKKKERREEKRNERRGEKAVAAVQRWWAFANLQRDHRRGSCRRRK